MAEPLILVVGATGTVGSRVVRQLVAAGHRVRALSRAPAKAAALGRGVEVVEGDLARPETLEAAFAGVARVFVATPSGPQQPALEGHAFGAAKRAGAEHAIKLSGGGVMFQEHVAGTAFVAWHREGEAKLRASGVPWTILRAAAFHTNVFHHWRILERGGLQLPAGDGKDSHVAPDDLAAVAVRILTAPAAHRDEEYDLTGPELLGYGELAERVAAATGRALPYVAITDAAFREQMARAGASPLGIEFFSRYFAGVKAGRMYLTGDVARVLGRPAQSFGAWLDEHPQG